MAPNSKLTATWYPLDEFLYKAEQEIFRALRYQVPFTVISCSLAYVNSTTGRLINDFVTDGLRQIDFAAKLGNGRYAFALPFTSSAGAESVASRLDTHVRSYQPVIGYASAPNDGKTVTILLNSAEQNSYEDAGHLQRAG